MKKTLNRRDVATIRYTAALTRVFKSSFKGGQPLHVSGPNDDGYIFVTNGVILVKLNLLEYDELIRPITQRDPAAYVLDHNGVVEGREPLDMEKTLADTAANSAAPVTLAPFTFAIDKKTRGAFFYNADADAVILVNADFVSAFTAYGTFKAGASCAPVVIDQGDEEGPDPIALILPIRPKNNKVCAAVRAYYIEQPAADASQLQQERDELRRKVDELTAQRNNGETIMTDQQNKICELLDQRDALAARLAAIQAAPTQNAPAADPAPVGKLDELTAAVKALGLACTVKGQQTAAPVIWVDGDPGEHKADLEALGGKWSGKRSAWYLKV